MSLVIFERNWETLVSIFGPETIPEDWPTVWSHAMERFEPQVPFLQERFIDDACAFCAFPDEIRGEFQAAAGAIVRDPFLSRAACFFHALYFRDPMSPSKDMTRWPFETKIVPWPMSMITALVFLAGGMRLREIHVSRHIPEAITRATLRDIFVWMEMFHRQRGYWGLSNIAWLRHHLAGDLYRLGRLQFMMNVFRGDVKAYLHKESGLIIALSMPGISYRKDGLVNGTNAYFDSEAWIATLEEKEDAFVGYPIDPRGNALAETVTLSKTEWTLFLSPGDPIIDIHIPEGGPMDFAQCGESIDLAVKFFPAYFPEKPTPVAFCSNTWMFDSQLTKLLPPTSNIVRFLKEFYLYPSFSDEKEPFRRVYGYVPDDLKTVPRDTTLRRAIADFTLSGGHLCCAGGFLPIKGLTWGSARFQANSEKRR